MVNLLSNDIASVISDQKDKIVTTFNLFWMFLEFNLPSRRFCRHTLAHSIPYNRKSTSYKLPYPWTHNIKLNSNFLILLRPAFTSFTFLPRAKNRWAVNYFLFFLVKYANFMLINFAINLSLTSSLFVSIFLNNRNPWLMSATYK